ncbi:Neurotransmitter-gated ion-channel ligand binding domain protein [Necator americanus]|uniref:Neurotransmitter-gated ion-channel ligand binding domain protein n=1 Tax=Necator americanus TaxID=51031 RepID=W2SUL6_NECAM|nr:Neurotransmitter-gated ion-channel ligand binding domain protein [Necator americanus]ETN73305.1 Neurotransmitter-gated ion-channel ligand binding domain protein [Necator americanus]
MSISDIRIVCILVLWIIGVQSARDALVNARGEFLPHIRLAKDLMDKRRLNEKQQNVDLNVWVIQKWKDDFLGWNPYLYGMMNTTILPYDAIWLPDTYLYNSVVMNREETERYINVVVTTNFWKGERGAEIKFMYPALYRTSCMLDIRFFPYDQQECKLTISSWTSSKSDIDYEAEFDSVNLDNFIPNEEWVVVSFKINRVEEKFVCCPEPWVLLEAVLVVRRKPLYYIVNLVIPTSVITMVAVTGFFTAASTSLFYLTIIIVIFIGTLFTAFILNIHLQKMYARPVSPLISFIFFNKVASWLRMSPPTMLLELWEETGVHFGRSKRNNKSPKSSKAINVPSSSSTHEFLLKSPSATAFEFSSPQRSLIPKTPEEAALLRSQKARNNWKRLAKKASVVKFSSTFPPTTTFVSKGWRARSPDAMSNKRKYGLCENNMTKHFQHFRYALEWEYLATVLDRLLLIVFSLVVFLVTFLMILIGEAMHLSYELSSESVISSNP